MKTAIKRDQTIKVTVSYMLWDNFEQSYSEEKDSFTLHAYCERGLWEVYAEACPSHFKVLEFSDGVTELNEEVMERIIDRASKVYYDFEPTEAKVELYGGTMELKLFGWHLFN